MKTVLIGIQARSTSTRLPNKVHMQIGGKPLLQRVIDSCQIAARFLRNESNQLHAAMSVCLLVPKGDAIVELYKSQLPVLEGDENDVLSRYMDAAKAFNADYIVRVTADCLLIPAHHIAKHIKAAIVRERDYTTNTHYRTHKEGWDCEVLTRRLLDWISENATKPEDREHVTTIIARGKYFPFKGPDNMPSICHIMHCPDESAIKTSIDTKEEYEAAEQMFQKYDRLRRDAKRNGTVIT